MLLAESPLCYGVSQVAKQKLKKIYILIINKCVYYRCGVLGPTNATTEA